MGMGTNGVIQGNFHEHPHEIFGCHISWLSDIVCFEVVELFLWSC